MSVQSKITQEQVLQALSVVVDPHLKKDIVTLGMVKNVEIDGAQVAMTVVLTTPGCPIKAQFEHEINAALEKLELKPAKIHWSVDASIAQGASHCTAIEGVSRIIAVSSGKGGVGKSTVAVNLAVSLAQKGWKVGLLDADIYGPNIPTMMGCGDQVEVYDGPDGTERYLPAEAHGVKVMSMGLLLEDGQPVIWRGPMLHKILDQFFRQVEWGQLDALVIDMPPGTGDVQLSVSSLVPLRGAVLVTTPQEVASQDVRRAVQMFQQVKVPILGVVENMSYFVCDHCDKKHELFGSGGGQAIATKFKLPLLEQIPLQPSVRDGGDHGAPVSVRDPQSPVAQSFAALAWKIMQAT